MTLHVKTRLLLLNVMVSYDIIEKKCEFIRVMILLRKNVNFFHTIHYLSSIPYQSKVMLIEEAVVLNLCKITEPRKQKLKVEILHDLKEF